MMKWGLRTKVLVWIGLIILGVLGISTLLNIVRLKRYYLEAITLRAEALAQGVIYNATYLQAMSPSADVDAALSALSPICTAVYEANKDSDVVHIAVLTRSGIIAAHNDIGLWDTRIESVSLLAALQQQKLITVFDHDVYHTLVPIIGVLDTYLGSIDIGVSRRVVDERIQQILRQAAILLLLLLALAFFPVLLLVYTTVLKPIDRLTKVSEAVAEGNLEQAIETQRTDELGRLARSFAMMRDAIREKIVELQHVNTTLDHQVAERTREVEALQYLIHQVMAVAEELGIASTNLTQISMHMATGAGQSAQQVQRVSSHSHQISQSVHTAFVTTEEFIGKIRDLLQNLHEISGIVTTAVEIANSSSTLMAGLEKHSSEVGNITKMITNVTQQTNLLALNATIEAARAGDFGKGFGVVAQEVKELARETAVSADDISQKIGTIQISTREATEAMARVCEIVHRVSELSAIMTTAISQQDQEIQNISRMVAEADHDSSEIVPVMTDVAENVRKSSEQAGDVERKAQELAALAEQLRQLVQSFQQEKLKPLS